MDLSNNCILPLCPQAMEPSMPLQIGHHIWKLMGPSEGDSHVACSPRKAPKAPSSFWKAKNFSRDCLKHGKDDSALTVHLDGLACTLLWKHRDIRQKPKLGVSNIESKELPWKSGANNLCSQFAKKQLEILLTVHGTYALVATSVAQLLNIAEHCLVRTKVFLAQYPLFNSTPKKRFG